MHGSAGSTATATRALCVVLWIRASPSSAQPRSPIQQPGTRMFGQLHRFATGGRTSDRPCNCTKLAVQGRLPSQQLSSPAGSAQGQTHRGLAAMDFKFLQCPNPKGLRPPLGNPYGAPRGCNCWPVAEVATAPSQWSRLDRAGVSL